VVRVPCEDGDDGLNSVFGEWLEYAYRQSDAREARVLRSPYLYK
jgi:hypothetical protein